METNKVFVMACLLAVTSMGVATVSAAAAAAVQSDQKLILAVNDAKEPVEIAVPYTLGTWEQTKPVEIALAKGGMSSGSRARPPAAA